MKRSILALLLIFGAIGASAADGSLAVGVHLRVGGELLRLAVDTDAPVIVYDNVYYTRTVETVSTLAPVVRSIPQTTAVVVPPNASEILINGVSYPIDATGTSRTIEIVTGTVEKTVYEPQIVESTVYVPTDGASITGAVYIVPATVQTAWLQIGGLVLVGGKHRPHYVTARPPAGVVVVDGVWRYREGTRVVPLRSVPAPKGHRKNTFKPPVKASHSDRHSEPHAGKGGPRPGRW